MQKQKLFVELNEKEAATVNGAHHYYPCYWGYPVYYGGGYGYGSGSASNVTQTTNVNVVYND
ncbi:MAG TPA: hypothetical protein IGS17_15220 [Oscillatoriales cyanobacterium M59_W2019_021]|nr:MAG: hypothetical protein D6728_01475 [Cyanobacteria bacterium J055]HIK30123.1 hypothetical protein [Oscillatoriales cyanobacterium M4454_W2019_049]HIK52257.1 hypothetical protein [Oscillatoriales cyanobacterium M59_W2019_021]